MLNVCGIKTCFLSVVVWSECGRGRLCVSLPAGEVEDLQTKLRGEELPHLLPTLCRGHRGHQAEVPPQLPGHFQGTDTSQPLFNLFSLISSPNRHSHHLPACWCDYHHFPVFLYHHLCCFTNCTAVGTLNCQ